MRAAGIYDAFYELAENVGLTDFLRNQREQYLLLTNTFVQNFYYYPKESPPSVEFHLYDVVKKMSLDEFCKVCKIPFEGSLEEPHRKDVDGFIDTITVGETRKVSDARITSIHFPVLRYFAIFASRCLIGRGNCGNLSVLDIIILFHGLFCDNTVSMGGIIAKRLSLNRTKGPIFGGVYASRLAACYNIPIRHYEKEEKLLPTVYLDYKSMVAHDFIVKNREGALKYKLFFDKHHPETLPCLLLPCLIYLQASTLVRWWPFTSTGTLHQLQSQSRNHNLILHDSLITSGIRRRLPPSANPRLLLSTTPTITSDIRQASRGNRPT